MKFYDREKELELLEFSNTRRPSFVVISGKRRVGKTELIKKFIENKNAVYFFVDPYKTSESLINEFVEGIKKVVKIPSYVNISDTKSFLEFLFTNEELKKRNIIIVFDEFQRFLKINPSFIAQLQKYWDLYKNKTNLFLIISGSSIGMIKKIFVEAHAPLFKRADNFITLKDFDFWSISKILDKLDVHDLIEKFNLFGLFGGTIYYYTLLEKYKVNSFKGALDTLILTDLSPLKTEVQDIFIEEFGRLHHTYFEIIHAIARGKVSRKEIADTVRIKDSSLSPYLYDLSAIVNLIEWRIPVTEHPSRSKRGRYFLTNNFIRFWFRYIYPDRSLYEIGKYERIEEKILEDWNRFMGFVFEEFSRNFVIKVFGADFNRIGGWWDRRGNEIDILCINDKNKNALFLEVKWRDLSYHDAVKILEELAEKTKYLSTKFQKNQFGLIVRNVKEKTRLREKGYFVFDLEDMTTKFTSS